MSTFRYGWCECNLISQSNARITRAGTSQSDAPAHEIERDASAIVLLGFVDKADGDRATREGQEQNGYDRVT